jgi:glycosyltransferase involved in cell wall biosynthesis
MKKISVIIPCYNELKTIETILRRVEKAYFPKWEKEIIVVDDYSTDGTRDILKKYENRIKIIYQLQNGGKGTAVRRGLKEATGDYIIIQDADLEYNPDEIKSLLSALDSGYGDAIFGSRNLHHEKRTGFCAPRLGVWFITKLLNTLYGMRLTDAWTCYKLFPQQAKGNFQDGGFDSELLFTAALARQGLKIFEVPISHRPRDFSEGKKIRYRDGFRAIFLLIGDRLLHLRKSSAQQPAEYESGINWLKSFLKQFPKLYYGIWQFFCPVLMIQNGPRKILSFVKKGSVILDVGSGPERLGDEFINVDFFPFPGVDVVADARALPFNDSSVDGVVSESFLEHIDDPYGAAREMMRVLKPGGFLYASAPFIHPYHASPDDFGRWSMSGLKSLFSDIEIVEQGVRSGPWSALLMFLAYWLGVIFSFGFKKAAPFLAHIFMLVLGPLKYLDLIFARFPGAENVSAHLYIIGRKKII